MPSSFLVIELCDARGRCRVRFVGVKGAGLIAAVGGGKGRKINGPRFGFGAGAKDRLVVFDAQTGPGTPGTGKPVNLTLAGTRSQEANSAEVTARQDTTGKAHAGSWPQPSPVQPSPAQQSRGAAWNQSTSSPRHAHWTIVKATCGPFQGSWEKARASTSLQRFLSKEGPPEAQSLTDRLQVRRYLSAPSGYLISSPKTAKSRVPPPGNRVPIPPGRNNPADSVAAQLLEFGACEAPSCPLLHGQPRAQATTSTTTAKHHDRDTAPPQLRLLLLNCIQPRR